MALKFLTDGNNGLSSCDILITLSASKFDEFLKDLNPRGTSGDVMGLAEICAWEG